MFKVFVNAGFRYCEALNGPVGTILASFVPNGPQKLSKSGQKESPNMDSKISTKHKNVGSLLGSILKPKIFPDGEITPRSFFVGPMFKRSCFQHCPEMARDDLRMT